jgi:hypothetical protein
MKHRWQLRGLQIARQSLTFLGTVLFCITAATSSIAQILNPNDIDAICRSNKPETHRNTLVYVDLSSIKSGEDEWGYTILKKLELAPRERVTVLGVNPSTFEILEVFYSCYPTFTQSEISQIRSNRSIWDKLITQDPETHQRENLQTFDARLRNSLDKAVSASKKYVPGKRRNILGAIAVDKNRFTQRDAVYRMIIFTNAVISDEFETGTNEQQIVDWLIKKYPTSFSGAEVSVFGVTGGDRVESIESKGRIFSSFFLSNWARVRSFTASLPQQTNSLFSAVKNSTGTFEGGGIKGAAKLSFSAANGTSTNIWLTFVRGPNLLYVPIEGEYSCSGNSCSLKGRVIEQIPLLSSKPYFREGDQVDLQKIDEKLVGTLKSESKEIFSNNNAATRSEEVKYQIELVGLN